METTEPKKEVTNEFLLDKSVEFTNIILRQTDLIKSKESEIWDHMEPTYNNVRYLIDLIRKLDAKIEDLDTKVSKLQSDVEKLKYR